MASVSGSFVADGESAVLTGVFGNATVSAKYVAGAKGSVYVKVSYDAGVTWFALEGGSLGNSGADRVLIIGDTSESYKLVARGVNGTIKYFMGAA